MFGEQMFGMHEGKVQLKYWQNWYLTQRYQGVDKMKKETLKLVHNRQTIQMKEKVYKLEQVVLTCKG